MSPKETRKLKYELAYTSLSNILKENLQCELYELSDFHNINEIRNSLNDIAQILCKKLSYNDVSKLHKLTYKNFKKEGIK